MKYSKQNHTRQLKLFFESAILPSKPTISLFTLPEDTQPRRINHMAKFKPFHEFQKPLIGFTPEAFLDYVETVIPQDHLCRLVKEVVFSLDTVPIEAMYSFLGQRTYHPKLLLSVLFYGYAIGKIYLDGTKIKGNASAKRTKDRAGFEKWLSEIEEEIATVLKEAETIDKQEDDTCKVDPEQEALQKKLSDRTYLKKKIEEALEVMKEEGKEKINLTDRDANHMKSGGSKDIRPGYNCQAAVTESGIIVAGEAVTEANDRNQLKPMIEKTELNTQEKVKEVGADSGYGSYANYEYLEERGIEGYIPDDHFRQYKSGEYQKEENRYHYTNFTYDSASDSYVCPEGKRLVYWKTRTNKTDSRQWNHKVYRGREGGACQKRSLCTKAKVRELLIDIREPLLQKMREKLISDEGRRKYFMRQYIIEPVFGHLKFNVGYRNFLLRGLEKVRAEFKLMCIGGNLKKMLKLKIRPATV